MADDDDDNKGEEGGDMTGVSIMQAVCHMGLIGIQNDSPP